jgi:hypothetical protein
MVDLALLQSVSYIAGALGVCVAAIYYVVILREQRQTRQFQLLMQIRQYDMTKEGQLDLLEWNQMEWSDYDDFEKKYGSDVNPNNYAMRMLQVTYFRTLGILVKNGMISRELAYEYVGDGVIYQWNKYRDIVLTQRKLYNMPMANIHWEHLYDEMVKIAKEGGVDTTLKFDIGYTEEMRERVISGKV